MRNLLMYSRMSLSTEHEKDEMKERNKQADIFIFFFRL